MCPLTEGAPILAPMPTETLFNRVENNNRISSLFVATFFADGYRHKQRQLLLLLSVSFRFVVLAAAESFSRVNIYKNKVFIAAAGVFCGVKIVNNQEP